MNKRRVTILLIIIILILAGVFLNFLNKEKSPIRIGFDATLSGKSYDIGVASRNAIVLAVDEVNKSGGINGHKLELIIKDDKYDMEKAKENIEEMAKEMIPVVFAATTSQVAEMAVPYANSKDILLISPTVSNPKYTQKDDNFIRMISTSEKQGQELAKYIQQKACKEVAFISDLSNKAYTYAVKDSFSKAFKEKRGKIVYYEDIPDDTEGYSFEELAKKLLNKKVKCILISASASKTALISQNISKISKDKPNLFFSAWAMTNELLLSGGKGVEGAYVIEILDANSKSAKMNKFRKDYENEFGEKIGNHAIRAYDTAMAVFEALRKCETITPTEIKKQIINKVYNGAQGEFYIDGYGDYIRDFMLFKIENNTYKLVSANE